MSNIIALRRSWPPTNHFDYGVLNDECHCAICLEWRTNYNILQNSPAVHHRRDCLCDDCQKIHTTRSAYIAANNRRDLYCESSWHASFMEPMEMGEVFMSWLRDLLLDRSKLSNGWWENHGSCFPMSYWIGQFRQATMGASTLDEDDIFAVADTLPLANAALLATAVSGLF